MFRLSAIFCLSLMFSCASQRNAGPSLNGNIDYGGFRNITKEVALYRQSRLIDIEQFNRLSNEPNTIILDTRSKEAYDAIHLRGAVHLNFSDFTEDKLAHAIPDKQTRVLIYCNNNFNTRHVMMMMKMPPLALNIPTFINLYGYGYENVYELNDLLLLDDPRLSLEGSQAKDVSVPE